MFIKVKLNIAFLLFSIPLFFLYSNDTLFYHAFGGSPISVDSRNDIALEEETIIIFLEPDKYIVDVTFHFKNNGPDTKVEVGFPKFYISNYPDAKLDENFLNFQTYVNDSPVEHELREIEGYGRLKDFFVKEVTYPSGESTTTRINYESVYGRISMGYKAIPYLYGTGMTWSDSWKMNIEIHNNTDFWISSINLHETISDIDYENGITKITIDNVIPDEIDEDFSIFFSKEATHIIYDYFWINSDRVLTELELKTLSNDQLRISRNFFFAKYGYIFKSPDLDSYFRETDWYTPDPGFTRESLNDFEELNVELILEEERRRR